MSEEKAAHSFDVDEKTAAVLHKKGYRVLKKISAGAFGEVYKATNDKRNELNAVKVMHLKKVEKSGLNQKFLDREIAALIRVRHPNVLKVHDIFKSAGRLYIFMEFAPNGTLTAQVKKSKDGFLSEAKVLRWFRQCVDALVCMHAVHKMAHRDIKLDNVLLDSKNNCKLSDFGFAREFDSNEDKLAETFCGTRPYFSPEILAHQPYNPFLADVWAMAVMCFEMLNGNLPFKVSKKNRKESLVQMKQKKYKTNPAAWDKVSLQCKDLIDSMFTFNPEERPNIVACRKHAWFK